MQRVTTGGNIALPEGQKIELLESARRAGGDYSVYCSYLDAVIAKVILGQSATTEIGPWKGTADVQKAVRDDIVAADSRRLNESLNRSLVRWLTDWNFPGAAYPKVVRDTAPPENLDARAAREEIIGRTTGLKPTRQHVEQVYGGEWEEASEANDSTRSLADPDRESVRFADADVREPDTVDGAVSALTGDWAPLMEPLVEPALQQADEMSKQGKSLEEFRDRLGDLYRNMKEEKVGETLHRMSFSAGLSGEAGLHENNVPPDSND